SGCNGITCCASQYAPLTLFATFDDSIPAGRGAGTTAGVEGTGGRCAAQGSVRFCASCSGTTCCASQRAKVTLLASLDGSVPACRGAAPTAGVQITSPGCSVQEPVRLCPCCRGTTCGASQGAKVTLFASFDGSVPAGRGAGTTTGV